MKISTYSKNSSFTEAMISRAEEKLSKLKKFIKDDEPVKLNLETFKNSKLKLKSQIVLKNNKHIRTEVDGNDYYDCLDETIDNLLVQAKASKERNSRKERIQKVEEALPEVAEPAIKKIKRFNLDAITEGMAMIELEKLGHEYYVFKNANEEDKVCVLYKRLDGDYSMIVIDN